MAEDTLEISSGRGIDFALSVAGLGARAYAFIIDWHIRVVLVLGWILGATLVLRPYVEDSGIYALSVSLPPSVIYLLYHPVVELAMQGNSPGKRYAGVRVVTQEGKVPSRTEILVRNVLRLVDSLPVFYGVGMVACLVTGQSRRIGDLAAGTLLVYDHRDHSLLADAGRYAGSRHSVIQLQAVESLLDRWNQLDDQVRADLAVRLLTKLGEPAAPEVSTETLKQQLEDITGSMTDKRGKLQSQ